MHTQGTVSSDKNELLFSQFGINYNNIPAIFRKGSILIWSYIFKEQIVNKSELESTHTVKSDTAVSQEKTIQDCVIVSNPSSKKKRTLSTLHCDIISEEFWEANKYILNVQ